MKAMLAAAVMTGATLALPLPGMAQSTNPPGSVWFQGPPIAFQWSRPPGQEPPPTPAEAAMFAPASLGTDTGLRREIFLNIPGAALADLTNHAKFPNQPDVVETISAFEVPSNSGDEYGVRVSGYLVPPTHGAYRFYLSANGQAALFLSLDEHPGHKRPIAFEPVGNGPREWTNGVNQASRGNPATNVSGAIQLVAGQAYYVEALMKAGTGDDNLGVVWQLPNALAPSNGTAPIGATSLALSPPTNSLPTTGEAVPEQAGLDYEMLRFMRIYGVNGGLLAVMKDGRLVSQRGYGWHDKLRTRAINPGARFRFASICKGMNAAATKQLIARGLFQTNTAVFPYIGSQPYNGAWGDARLNQITVYHCLNHQGGWDRSVVGDPLDRTVPISEVLGLDRPATSAEFISYQLTQPLQFAPGASYAYANLGFMVVGRVTERATGQRWFDVVETEVWRPWGANGIQLLRTPEKLVQPDEPYYTHETVALNAPEFPTAEVERNAYGGNQHLEPWDPAGGVIGSTEDLLRYAQAYVVGGSGDTVAGWFSSYYLMGNRRLVRRGTTANHGGQVWGSNSGLYQRTDGVDWAAFLSFTPAGTEYSLATSFNAAFDRVVTWPGDNSTRVQLASDSFSVEENEGTLTIGVRRTGESTGVVSAAWATLPGSALPGAEFTASSGTVSFASNEITALITIPILDDAVAEPAKSFSVVLSEPTGGAGLGIASATVAIEDDDNRQPPSIAITAPADGAVFPVGANVSLTASPADSDGRINTVTFHAGPTLLGEENKPPYTFVWKQPAPGTYLVTARAVDNHRLISTSAPVVVTVGAGLGLAVPGTILREFWNRRPTNSLALLTNYAHYPGRPTGREYLDLFEISTNRGDHYGTKLSGYVHAPATGQYVFWIAADDVAQLWLSTDDNPGNKRLIASLASASTPRNWTAQPSQQSAAIELTAGQRYYVEALHRESVSSDHLAVGWRLPDGTLERPMPGSRLSPYLPTGRPFIASVTVLEGDSGASHAVFAVSLNGTNAQTVTVNYATSDGTANAGSDYTAVNGSLTFSPGELSKPIMVPVLGDMVGEPTETFFVRLIDPADPQFISQAQGAIVADDLYIAQHPQGGLPRAGSNVTLSVSAISPRPISYQWRFNGSDLAGQTAPTLILPSIQLAQDGEYTVALNDGAAAGVSEPARIIVLVQPVITQAPVSQSVVAGGNAAFSAAILANPPPYTYYWRRVTTPAGLLTQSVSDARSNFITFNTTAAGFVLAGSLTMTNFQCRVVVSNLAAIGQGAAATFNLTLLADSDSDGIPDAWETMFGFNPTNAMDRELDMDGDLMGNWEEYIAGTDPTDPLSFLGVSLAAGPASAAVSFGAVSNRTYTVQFTDDLGLGFWSKLGDVLARTNNRVETFPDPTYTTNRFYRAITPRVP